MRPTAEPHRITDEAQLRSVIKEPSRTIAEKATSVVDAESARFIAASPFFLLATTASDGTMDVSPRGDPPGSVQVLNDGRTLAFGDRKGNRRLDSMRNILAHPRVGMLFLVPGSNDTLRVNGEASIWSSGPFFEDLTVRGARPQLAVTVDIEELFLHCGKAFLRAELWDHTGWPDRDTVPRAADIAKSQFNSKAPAGIINAALKLDERFRRY